MILKVEIYIFKSVISHFFIRYKLLFATKYCCKLMFHLVVHQYFISYENKNCLCEYAHACYNYVVMYNKRI